MMNKGRIVEDGKPEKVFSNDQILEASNLEKPMVVKIFQLLKEKNIIDENLDKIPCNIEQLEYIIRH